MPMKTGLLCHDSWSAVPQNEQAGAELELGDIVQGTSTAVRPFIYCAPVATAAFSPRGSWGVLISLTALLIGAYRPLVSPSSAVLENDKPGIPFSLSCVSDLLSTQPREINGKSMWKSVYQPSLLVGHIGRGIAWLARSLHIRRNAGQSCSRKLPKQPTLPVFGRFSACFGCRSPSSNT